MTPAIVGGEQNLNVGHPYPCGSPWNTQNTMDAGFFQLRPAGWAGVATAEDMVSIPDYAP